MKDEILNLPLQSGNKKIDKKKRPTTKNKNIVYFWIYLIIFTGNKEVN